MISIWRKSVIPDSCYISEMKLINKKNEIVMKILENRRDSNENGWKRMREKGDTRRWIENGEWFGDLEIQSLSNKIINILKVGLGTYRKKKSYKSINQKNS